MQELPPYGTISTSADECGVSVRNAHRETPQWFVLRVSYARILKAQAFAESKGVECYVPMRYVQSRNKSGRKRLVTEPLFPSFLFVHATRPQVDTLLSDCKHAATRFPCAASAHNVASASSSASSSSSSFSSIPLLSFYYDHTVHLDFDPTRNPPLVIPSSAMDNFIRLISIKNPHIIPVTSPNIRFKLGDLVLITEGEFAGIRGRVARIAGQQRVVVELFEGCLVGTAYVPREMMRNVRV